MKTNHRGNPADEKQHFGNRSPPARDARLERIIHTDTAPYVHHRTLEYDRRRRRPLTAPPTTASRDTRRCGVHLSTTTTQGVGVWVGG